MLPWIPLGLLAAGLATAAYAVFVERRWYRLARHRLDILPAGAEGLTVLHLSDLHLTEADGSAASFMASLPRADLTVLTGDVVGDPRSVEFVVRSLRPVRGRVASLFVLGSNDLYAPQPLNWFRYFVPSARRKPRMGRRGRPGDLVRLLERDGWVHLKNRKYERRTNGVRMEIVGLDDPHVHRADPRVAPRTMPDAFGLAVVHSPDPAPELAALGYDLVVAGHTHGGQVRLPMVGALVTNCSLPTRLARGLVRLGSSYLHVSPGLGTSKYAPFRLFCRPEATLLELRPAGRQDSARIRSKQAS
jgi:predicted MPP superfamily phosphohydrolase